MFRSLIALVLAFTIAISGIVKPASANSFNFSSAPTLVVNNRGVDDNATPKNSNPFFDGLINGAMNSLGLAIGGAVVCYTIDGVATMFFPPAATLAAFCPAVGGVVGGGNAVMELK